MLQNKEINAFLLIYFINLWILKNKMQQALCSTSVFNVDNNQKCLLSSKSVYYYDFWRSCDTEDWSNDVENSAAHHRNKLHIKYIFKEKSVILNGKNISKFFSFYYIFKQINAAS